MARRHLWRNDVVRSYWRTRHPLLRFLCLHEAVTLPFVVAISDPTTFCDYPFALRRLPQWNFVLLAVKCHGVSPLSTAPFFPGAHRAPPRLLMEPWAGVRMSSSRRWRVSRQASPFLSLPLPSAHVRIRRSNFCMIFCFLARRHVISFPSG